MQFSTLSFGTTTPSAMAALVQRLTSASTCFGLLTWLLFANVAFSGQIVKQLPGFDGELPFKLETGYINVGDSELFYYFIESQGDPERDPLFLWLTGGPGCSSFSGLILEIGPLEFDVDNYKAGLPELKYYKYAWTKAASFIFLDAPVGSGFSYARTPEGWNMSDSEYAEQSYQFLKKWLFEHPQYLKLQLFIGGDSYSGIPVPLITKKVIDGNEARVHPHLNLQGYIVGNPLTDSIIDGNSRIVLAHRLSFISDELYEKLKTSCNEMYVDVDPSNSECLSALAYYQVCVKDINSKQVLEPNCLSWKANAEAGRRSVKENPSNFTHPSPPRISKFQCQVNCFTSISFITSLPLLVIGFFMQNFVYMLLYLWANDPTVQDALHVQKGMISEWVRCNRSLSYKADVRSVVDVHQYLSTKGLQLLVETGDHDMIVPHIGTEKWIVSLNLTIADDWRPWFIDGQVAGYTRKYAEHGFQLTFATVKGGGHPAPEFNRRECYEMFQRWIHYYPL
ncbi:serine carboxypeptidase-like 17 isoform X1 [Manihot esculenta]|uniref:serine carboxypeptidase-like 17 isoform X1 n=1 Tax=Manihot esculenta TaxID=3983 RepID=UPI000B5D1A70|nr:serine carboxypeptidase-like 17 isoform X1 [Manihot esculenta]XP_021624959.1 serine carboxypeptidase-like 17 isoform X1 [Manihot esculenta]XP_043816528.1 serine carboxypeptidase-like 17 isoform X1 [Manihot esculenta]